MFRSPSILSNISRYISSSAPELIQTFTSFPSYPPCASVAAAAVPSAVFAVVSLLDSVAVAPVSEFPQAAYDTTIIALNNPAKIFFFMYCSPL